MARGIVPRAVIGHSLGQIAGLALTGMIDVPTTFALVGERGRLMHEVAVAHPGGMTAVLRAQSAQVQDWCEACAQGEVLAPANYNCPGQIVVSGAIGAIERLEARCAQEGVRTARLATEGAFHSALMAPAADAFAGYLESVAFNAPNVPLICNVDARPLDAETARDHLARHLVSPVLFEEGVRHLACSGVRTFAEIGPGGVLDGLVRRIDKGLRRARIECRDDLEAFVG